MVLSFFQLVAMVVLSLAAMAVAVAHKVMVATAVLHAMAVTVVVDMVVALTTTDLVVVAAATVAVAVVEMEALVSACEERMLVCSSYSTYLHGTVVLSLSCACCPFAAMFGEWATCKELSHIHEKERPPSSLPPHSLHSFCC